MFAGPFASLLAFGMGVLFPCGQNSLPDQGKRVGERGRFQHVHLTEVDDETWMGIVGSGQQIPTIEVGEDDPICFFPLAEVRELRIRDPESVVAGLLPLETTLRRAVALQSTGL